MWESKGKVAIVGVGFSKLSRKPEGTLGARCMEACTSAINDAGLKLSDIDGIATYPDQPFRGAGNVAGIDLVDIDFILHYLDLAPHVKWYAEIGHGMVTSAVLEAVNALLAGTCKYALVWRALHQPQGRAYKDITTNVATGDSQFQHPYGFGATYQNHAFAYRRYMDQYGAKREHMATLAVTQRGYANKNENAFFYKTPLSREDYINARMISDPMCLYDCDIPVEGAAAVVLTRTERAKALRNPPAYVAGYAQNTDRRPELLISQLIDYMKAGASLADQMWDMSGLRPKDVDVALIYDGFSPSVYYALEAGGFCKQGEAFEFIQGGTIGPGGKLPLNTHGGSLSEGRLHGMGHLAEAVRQVTGRAGARQVPDCHVAYMTAASPLTRGSGMIITSEP